MTNFIPAEVDRYVYWIEERERIRHLKEEVQQEPPWTEDPILQEFKFCQVFREDDRTTRWFRHHIREPLRNDPEVFMATVAFRFFNLIETGETLLDHNLHIEWDEEKAIQEIRKQPKWITGSYIVKTPNGMDKVTGAAKCVSNLWKDLDRILEDFSYFKSLSDAWHYLLRFPYIGPFVSYELVTDLRHTHLLENAEDILSWANAGPGAMRGLNRLTGRPLEFCKRSWDWNSEMQALYQWCIEHLDLSKFDKPFEMREIEGGLCEFDKYSRILHGQGRTRSVYDYSQKDRPLIEEYERKNGKT